MFHKVEIYLTMQLLKDLYFMYRSVCLHIAYMQQVGSLKRSQSGPEETLELDLQMVVTHRVVTEKYTQLLLKGNKCF